MPRVKSSAVGKVTGHGSDHDKELEALIRFEVEDTGDPIPMESIPTLFQSYSQANVTVGLYIISFYIFLMRRMGD